MLILTDPAHWGAEAKRSFQCSCHGLGQALVTQCGLGERQLRASETGKFSPDAIQRQETGIGHPVAITIINTDQADCFLGKA